MSFTGHADGEPGGGPMKVGVALADIMTGMYASTAILAALAHRAETGVGQHIELRNKESVTIDFTRPEGQKLVRDLAAKSDVVIENFKVGGLKKHGLDYASLKSINPRTR